MRLRGVDARDALRRAGLELGQLTDPDERVPLVRPKNGGLAAGATKEFRLPFDNLGQNWNQRMPQMVIAGIVF